MVVDKRCVAALPKEELHHAVAAWGGGDRRGMREIAGARLRERDDSANGDGKLSPTMEMMGCWCCKVRERMLPESLCR